MSDKMQSISYKAAFAVLLAVVGFFCVRYVSMLEDIRSQIVELKIDVARIQEQLQQRGYIASR